MDQDKFNKVEEYIRTNCPEGTKILNITTTQTKNAGPKQAKFVTNVLLEEEKTGLQANSTFNTLKVYREIMKKEKYGQV